MKKGKSNSGPGAGTKEYERHLGMCTYQKAQGKTGGAGEPQAKQMATRVWPKKES